MDGVVVICAKAREHIRVIGTSSKIQLAREPIGWAKLRGMHAPRILNLQNCDANKDRGLREELDAVLQGTPRSLAVAIRTLRKKMPSDLRVEKHDRPARRNIVRNYAVTEDGCQEELRFWLVKFSELASIVVFFITCSTFRCRSNGRPVISRPRHCDPQHRTVWIRSRDFCVAYFATKTIFYSTTRGFQCLRFVLRQSPFRF